MTENQKIFFIAKTVKNSVCSENSSITNSKEWTEDEDNQLINLANSVFIRKKWILLEKYFPGKNSLDLNLRYLKINPQIKKGKWTEKENEKLKSLVAEFGFNWALFAKIMRNRSCKQIRSHYENYLRDDLDLKKSFTVVRRLLNTLCSVISISLICLLMIQTMFRCLCLCELLII